MCYEVPAHLKGALLLELLKQPGFQRVLVFTRMKDGADRLTEFLKAAHVKAAKLHSSRSQEQRLQALQDFKDGKAQVLVATDIVARGIDIDGVTHVVNYDFPVNPRTMSIASAAPAGRKRVGWRSAFVPKQDLNLLGILELFIARRLDRKTPEGIRLPRAGSAHSSPAKNRRAATGGNAPAKWRRKKTAKPAARHQAGVRKKRP
jgi:ATP-dependent RNA helicase RhlE